MKWSQLLEMLDGQPIFEPAMLLAGEDSSASTYRQLARWVEAGKLIQLRRGLYAVAHPFNTVRPHPFMVAGRLHWPSYVSLQSALAWYGLIPESVPAVTSVTTRRPMTWQTTLGAFRFRHVKTGLFSGYREVRFENGQTAFVAEPEKALLDLCHLTPGADSEEFITELRFDPETAGGVIDPERLLHLTQESGSPKLGRCADRYLAWLEAERSGRESV